MDGEKSLIIKKKKSSTLVLGTIQIYQRPKKKKKTQHSVQGYGWLEYHRSRMQVTYGL